MIRPEKILVGMKVYHSHFPHWGTGTVTTIRDRDGLELRSAKKYAVVWAGGTKPNVKIWMTAADLRATPNKKKADLLKSLKPEAPRG